MQLEFLLLYYFNLVSILMFLKLPNNELNIIIMLRNALLVWMLTQINNMIEIQIYIILINEKYNLYI